MGVNPSRRNKELDIFFTVTLKVKNQMSKCKPISSV
jgi:hypothetical protein